MIIGLAYSSRIDYVVESLFKGEAYPFSLHVVHMSISTESISERDSAQKIAFR